MNFMNISKVYNSSNVTSMEEFVDEAIRYCKSEDCAVSDATATMLINGHRVSLLVDYNDDYAVIGVEETWQEGPVSLSREHKFPVWVFRRFESEGIEFY